MFLFTREEAFQYIEEHGESVLHLFDEKYKSWCADTAYIIALQNGDLPLALATWDLTRPCELVVQEYVKPSRRPGTAPYQVCGAVGLPEDSPWEEVIGKLDFILRTLGERRAADRALGREQPIMAYVETATELGGSRQSAA